jgi:putative Holliday junction resolvase
LGGRGLKGLFSEEIHIGRIMGLDIGDKRIGVALSDPLGWMASPSEVVLRESDAVALTKISELIQQHQVERVVVGLPRSLDGSLNQQAIKVQAFAEELSRRIKVPVEFWDERLSTVAANRLMIDTGTKKGDKKSKRDAISSALVLQAYLDSKQKQD